MHRALLAGLTTIAVGSLASAQAPPATPAATFRTERPAGPEFGVVTDTYFRQSFAEFFPIDPVNHTYHDDLGGHFGRYSSVFMVGSHPKLPGGALLTYLELDACDFDSSAFVRVQLYACDFLGACGDFPIADLITATDGAPGCGYISADLTSLGYVIDNYLGQLVPRITTSPGTSSSALILGLVYGYRLQVRPAPATATFNDVPTNHPFFQFVEALVSSGITAGCGMSPPLYCPDAPLTRGQMAVFLAKALGLHWPEH